MYRAVRSTKKLPAIVEEIGKRLYEGENLQWLVGAPGRRILGAAFAT